MVTAVIVTRGDVDLKPVVESLPREWEQVIWDNSGTFTVAQYDLGRGRFTVVRQGEVRDDHSVLGRYYGVNYASNELIYVQDDDVVVSDPRALLRAWQIASWNGNRMLVANMPEPHRANYDDSCLVGFGAMFHRDAAREAFERFSSYDLGNREEWTPGLFARTCDVVFTTLTPFTLIDVPIEHMPYASDDNRMWKQPTHVSERAEMLRYARRVRDSR
jgi:hypothetical protein